MASPVLELSRDAQIPGTWSQGRIYFVWWSLIFVGAACRYFGSWNTNIDSLISGKYMALRLVRTGSSGQIAERPNSNRLNTKINLSYMYTLSSYRAVNTLHLVQCINQQSAPSKIQQNTNHCIQYNHIPWCVFHYILFTAFCWLLYWMSNNTRYE